MSPVEQRRLLCSLAFHIIALSCVLWSLYVLIEKMVLEASGKDPINWAFW
jgi:E3 ubiquitin-protein ligase MARCH1/8